MLLSAGLQMDFTNLSEFCSLQLWFPYPVGNAEKLLSGSGGE